MSKPIDSQALTKAQIEYATKHGQSTELRCERCEQVLDPAKIVWLELNLRTHEYSKTELPEAVSQGCFPFGAACARHALKHGVTTYKGIGK